MTSTRAGARILLQWAILMGGFWLIQMIFFTTFFTNTVNGLATGVVGSLGYWLAQQGVKRGSQPVYYYALIGWLYEFLPAVLSIGGFVTVFYNLVMSPVRHFRWDPVVAGDLPPSVARETQATHAEAQAAAGDVERVADVGETELAGCCGRRPGG